MSQQKHTPGPWMQKDDASPYGPSYAATVWGPDGPGHGLVADCRQGRGSQEVENARLIAAAPDMRRVLVGLLHLLPIEIVSMRDPRYDAINRLRQEGRDAIAKAEGQPVQVTP